MPQRLGSGEVVKKAPSVKKASSKGAGVSSDMSAGISTSKIDVDADPVYKLAGKPITKVNIDEDLVDNEKPWRRPGTDMTDYFNYGFDEFTWALYASKQDSLRSEYDQSKVAENQKKMMEDMNMMMMGGMPGMAGVPGGPAAMGGMDGMPAEMQQMMQQMMAQGMDPSQMDQSAMFGQQGPGFGPSYAQGPGFGPNRGGRGNFKARGRGRGF
jgi:pre-mRNA 3'-end-processing factor FIP1